MTAKSLSYAEYQGGGVGIGLTRSSISFMVLPGFLHSENNYDISMPQNGEINQGNNMITYETFTGAFTPAPGSRTKVRATLEIQEVNHHYTLGSQ